MMLSNVLLPQPDGPIRHSKLAARDIERGAFERNHPPRIPLRTEGLADAFDFDNRIAPIHVLLLLIASQQRITNAPGRNFSVYSLLISGSAGSRFICTKERPNTATALGSNRPVSEKVGITAS